MPHATGTAFCRLPQAPQRPTPRPAPPPPDTYLPSSGVVQDTRLARRGCYVPDIMSCPRHDVAPNYTKLHRRLMCVRPYGEVACPRKATARVRVTLTIQTIKHSEHFGQELKEHTNSMTHRLRGQNSGPAASESRSRNQLEFVFKNHAHLSSQLHMYTRP